MNFENHSIALEMNDVCKIVTSLAYPNTILYRGLLQAQVTLPLCKGHKNCRDNSDVALSYSIAHSTDHVALLLLDLHHSIPQ